MKTLRYALEAALVHIIYGFFWLLPVEAASNLGGFIMRHVGPRLGLSRRARRNLTRAFPEKNASEINRIIAGMWDNLGRVAAEYPHLRRIAARTEFAGEEHLHALRDDGKPGILFGAHLANWEVHAIAAKRAGLPVHLVYRKPNNPFVDAILRHARDSGAAGQVAKGFDGAREIVSILKTGGHIGLMADQKMNEGLPIPFFGRDAMTAPAIAHFTMKFACPLHPTRVERLGGCKFRMTTYPAMRIEESGDREKDTIKILTEINALIESWVRERPEQWLWIHNRWPG